MSRPGYAILNTQIGKQDAMLVMSERLAKRMTALKEIRMNQKLPEMPDISDIWQTHNVFVTSQYKPHVKIGQEYISVQPEGTSSITLTDSSIPNVLKFSLKKMNGDFLNDMVVRIQFKAIGDTSISFPRYRYCDYPGIRLFKHVCLRVDELSLDDYITEDVLFHDKHYVTNDKKASWDKCMGQQTIYNGALYLSDQQVNIVQQFTDGAQTFKSKQDILELWIPLIFWFNLDAKQSLQTSLLGGLQRYIEISLNSLSNIIQAVNEQGTIVPINELHIENATLYARNIFVDPVIHDVLVNQRRVALIRLHKRQIQKLTKNNDVIMLKQLKHPIESILFGFRPDENDSNNINSFTRWHQFNKRVAVNIPIPVLINEPNVQPILQLVSRTSTFYRCEPIVSNIAFGSHSNTLFKKTASGFYSQYTQYRYPEIVSSQDCGSYSIHFNQFFKKFNPSGHYNSSVGRELTIKYEDAQISNADNATFYLSSKVINFLYYAEGTSVVYYIT
jgi:hypothetical protein